MKTSRVLITFFCLNRTNLSFNKRSKNFVSNPDSCYRKERLTWAQYQYVGMINDHWFQRILLYRQNEAIYWYLTSDEWNCLNYLIKNFFFIQWFSHFYKYRYWIWQNISLKVDALVLYKRGLFLSWRRIKNQNIR